MRKKIVLIFSLDFLLIILALIIYNPFLKLDLVGEKQIEVLFGSKYQEEGYTASLLNKDLTKSVKVTSNVNLEKIGTYEIKYVIKNGLSVRKIKRVVNVVDKEKPTITLKGDVNYSLCGKEYSELGYQAIDNVEGDISNKVNVKKENNKIIYTVIDSSGNEASITRNLIEKDEIKPEISLKGPSLITLKVGASYDDLGFNVSDNCDSNIEDRVVITNNINTNKVGTYEISYSVSDLSGNTNEVKRTIKVYEFEDTNAGYKEIVKGPTYINGILIVNKKYSIPNDFKADDTEALKALKEIQEAAKKENLSLPLKSGYRSYSTQAALYNRYLTNKGKVYADGISARAGHSEHQTGLAFDVGYVAESFGNTAAGKWLEANCHKYGFIIRYPKYKELVTGYNYEPWHIRYVGVEVATEIMEKNLTLEEYLGVYK